MRPYLSRTTGALIAMIAGTAVMLWLGTSFATLAPTLGAGCGSGATLGGFEANGAGIVTLGTAPTTCTITFSGTLEAAPSCAAMNTTNGGSDPVPVGAAATTTTLELVPIYPWVAGDKVSYLCNVSTPG
jgi:hypothetical protein